MCRAHLQFDDESAVFGSDIARSTINLYNLRTEIIFFEVREIWMNLNQKRVLLPLGIVAGLGAVLLAVFRQSNMAFCIACFFAGFRPAP